jgi:prepilin-type N-terminal cleavage/methylation domain-containing protein/prepilin-type processing-associated H-X9-DG protein
MKRRTRGFTLIELMVVVAIIVVLIVMLLPTLSKAKEEGYTVKCEANLHAIGIAFATYNQQNKDLMPQSEVWHLVSPADSPGNYAFDDRGRGWFSPGPNYVNLSWPESLYIDGDIATGPGNKGGRLSGRKTGDDPTNSGSWHYPICYEAMFMCPKHPVDQRRGDGPSQWGYGMAWCATSNLQLWQSTDFPAPPSPNLIGSAKLPVVARNLVPGHIVAVDAEVQLGRDGGNQQPAVHPYGVFQRHKRNQTLGANYLMADGHAEWSDRFALTPSPSSFKDDYGSSVLRQQGAKEGYVWTHGVSAQS